MSYLQLSEVGKTFRGRDGKPFVALDGVELAIERGEFVSVIGHSGCGKSTMLNLVAGLESVSRGRITVDGEPVRGAGPDRMVAFQNHSLLPWLTLRRNVALAVDQVHRKMTAKERAELVAEYLAAVKLTPAADRYPDQVSGGMKQRCGIARALATRPKILLLDEPFGALDALTRANLQDQLMAIWEKERLTVLMITHDVDEALLLSDRIVMMGNGPAAGVAEVMAVEVPRPRDRVKSADHPAYYRQRSELIYFLQQAKRDKALAKPAEAAHGLAPAAIRRPRLSVGFVPLLDCAPFAVAVAEGLFAEQGLDVTLSREPSWKAIGDGVRLGRLQAAQMVVGMPIALTLGIGGRPPSPTCTAMMLSRGGNAVTLASPLANAGVSDLESLKRTLQATRDEGKERPIFGMVHPASMHNLLLRAWLADAGIDPDRDMELLVIPPPQMVANLERGSIAGYCVGEPWNLRAVRDGLGQVLATDCDIWPAHPEKVLAARTDWATEHPELHEALVVALLKACARCDDPDYRKRALPALLSDPRYVGGQQDLFRACLTGPYDGGDGRLRMLDNLVRFADDSANLCRLNEMVWVIAQMARWGITAYPEDPMLLLSEVLMEPVLRRAASTAGVTLVDQDLSPIAWGSGPVFDPSDGVTYLNALTIKRPIKRASSKAA